MWPPGEGVWLGGRIHIWHAEGPHLQSLTSSDKGSQVEDDWRAFAGMLSGGGLENSLVMETGASSSRMGRPHVPSCLCFLAQFQLSPSPGIFF